MFTFSKSDLLNAYLATNTPNTTSYQSKTTLSLRGRSTTSLIATTPDAQQRIVGGIDWREKALVIEGKSWSLADLKCRIAGHSSNMRIWHWAGNDYHVNLHGKQWVAIPVQRLTPLVTMTQSVQRIFKPSRHATIQFHAPLDAEDMVFFLLVMIYSEIGWQDVQVDDHP